MTIRDQMPRTTCDCEGCQIGCRTMSGMCGIGDVARITDYAEHQHLDQATRFDREHFIETHFVASEGAKVGQYNASGGIDFYQIPTITPAQRPNGECVFYKHGRCSIHAVSPLGCALVDVHMTKEEGDAVIHPALAEIADDGQAFGPYRMLWLRLRELGRIATPIAERLLAFQRLFAAWWPVPRPKS